jgi:transposase
MKRHLNYPWPTKIGVDEHSFGTTKGRYYRVDYNTIVVDFAHHRLYRVCNSKSASRVFEDLKNIPGAEKVEDVVMDLSEGYRQLARALFPNARITADKFHVLKLLVPAINRRRKRIAGDRRKNPIGTLLLRSKYHLPVSQRWMVNRFLEPHPDLEILYQFKERLHGLYRTRGFDRASRAMDFILDDLKRYDLDPDLRRLRYTLSRWKTEILNYFRTGLTNGMTEGFNNKAKLVKKMAYGYRNRENYKLRLLNACFGSA